MSFFIRSCFMSYMQELKRVLSQPDSVLFIGSGASLWSGLPSWSKIINDLELYLRELGLNSSLVEAERARGDLLQAASYGFAKLTPQQIGTFIRNECQYGKSVPSELHQVIVSLGPTSFITTNYDMLIEQSLQKWKPDIFVRPPINNRHLSEIAEIIHARSQDFIFKPHGDAADADSIILTREQYRRLLPNGDRHSAFESLKTLMLTRPIVYIGFGLRDPDFLLIRDTIANTFQGGTRDHVALMNDISDDEAHYWKESYGLRILSYTTSLDANGQSDHSALLGILKNCTSPLSAPAKTIQSEDHTFTMTMLRYAAGKMQWFNIIRSRNINSMCLQKDP